MIIITDLNSVPSGSIIYSLGYESLTHARPDGLPNETVHELLPTVGCVTSLIEEKYAQATALYTVQLRSAYIKLAIMIQSSKTQPIYLYVTPDEYMMGYIQLLMHYVLREFRTFVGSMYEEKPYRYYEDLGIDMNIGYMVTRMNPKDYMDAIMGMGLYHSVKNTQIFNEVCNILNYTPTDILTEDGEILPECPIIRTEGKR